MSRAKPPPPGAQPQRGPSDEETQNIASAIAEVSERASLLIREEIELAKAEMAQKAAKLIKGAIVGTAAGVFFLTALVFALVGCAWLLYYDLPVNVYAYFWGFFAMAVILVALGVIAGLIAARAVKKGSPPVPNMAIDEARKIRESVKPVVDAAPGADQEAPSQAPAAGGEPPAEQAAAPEGEQAAAPEHETPAAAGGEPVAPEGEPAAAPEGDG